ncbi:MAG: hypothetical protein KHY46_02205 [Clostridiales bacterium]|nr:hypothetical protein [Clostridiales bacterium]
MLKYNREKETLYLYIKGHKDEISCMDEAEITAAFVLLGEKKRLVQVFKPTEEAAGKSVSLYWQQGPA